MTEMQSARYFTAAPPGMGRNGACRIVRGNTMGALVHRAVVYYNHDELPPTADIVGDLVVAQVKDRATAPFVRFLEFGSRDGVWTLRSVTGEPMTDVELEWAARVEWIRLPPPPGANYFKVGGGTERLGQAL